MLWDGTAAEAKASTPPKFNGWDPDVEYRVAVAVTLSAKPGSEADLEPIEGVKVAVRYPRGPSNW